MDSAAAGSAAAVALGVATLAASAEVAGSREEIAGSMAEAVDSRVEVMDSIRAAADTTTEAMATSVEADTTVTAETGTVITGIGVTTTEDATLTIVTMVDGGHGTTAMKTGTIPMALTLIAKATIRTIVMEAKDTIEIVTPIIERETTVSPTVGGENPASRGVLGELNRAGAIRINRPYLVD